MFAARLPLCLAFGSSCAQEIPYVMLAPPLNMEYYAQGSYTHVSVTPAPPHLMEAARGVYRGQG